MMLGVLLARAGVDVIVLEKHGDFLRDFRGDTIHPSTLELMHELGVLDELLTRPYQRVAKLMAQISGEEVTLADFSRLPVRCPFIALMPQWDFLNFLAEQGQRHPAFHLRMRAEVTGLIEDGGRVSGVRAKTPDGELQVRAELVVAADGRNSILREAAGLKVEELGAPMDTFWMRLSKRADDPPMAFRLDRGRILLLLDRGDYWQCGYVVRKGSGDELRERGIEALQAGILEIAPFLKNRVGELKDWSHVPMLTVRVDRLREWYRPGLLCIGDAAHAMSPVGGVGINLAIQDAVAAANELALAFEEGSVSVGHLAKIQHRRMFPTRMTQGLQVTIQKQLIARVLGTNERTPIPLWLGLMLRSKPLAGVRGRMVGIGMRAEHIATPDLGAMGTDGSVHTRGPVASRRESAAGTDSSVPD
jgi:2-polyprenyl-6-methoxyphenol hydroxylase-like FAD-dependent oxidoreductase